MPARQKISGITLLVMSVICGLLGFVNAVRIYMILPIVETIQPEGVIGFLLGYGLLCFATAWWIVRTIWKEKTFGNERA